MPMSGFFSESTLLKSKPPVSVIPKCGACGLYKTCRSPKMPVTGEGRRRVLIVGEAPGADEDKQGMQFVGKSGELLRHTLSGIGVDLRKDCWMTNSLICRPPDNATPTDKQIGYCQPNLRKTIEKINPTTIIPLGSAAVQSVLSIVWKDKIDSIETWVGWQIPLQKLNTWICPTWHPSYLLRSRRNDRDDPVLVKYFTDHLEEAFSKTKRPWKEVPDYSKKVLRIYDHREVRRYVDKYISNGRPTAIDLETNMLKPDSKMAKIVCCSLSDGKTTIAYPWVGEAIKQTKRIVKSNTPLVASNMKFEERWFLEEFGHGASNWWWDTMEGAHVDDNRRGITSIKFQAFIRLGAPSYSDHITPLFRSPHSNALNQIYKIDMGDLLLYCGIDSLLEVLVAKIQRKVMGYGQAT